MGRLLYVISISLQVSGALLLLFFSMSTKRQSILKEYFGKGLSSHDGKSTIIEYSENEFIEYFRRAYLNKCSFFYIAFGYLLGVFGDLSNQNKLVIILDIIFFTILLMSFAYFIINCIVHTSSEVNKKVTYSELEQQKLNVDITSISSDDIIKHFK